MSLVELLLVCAVLILIMGGVSNVFISGLRASSDTQSRLTSQENLRQALDRLEYETRCADTATLLSSGAGVHLHFETQCTHATGDVSWCVVSGALVRYGAATTCTGTGVTLASDITTATPFSCVTPDGTLPQLQIAMTVTAAATPGATSSQTEAVTLRNAALTSGGTSSCS